MLITLSSQAQDPVFSLQQTSPMNYNPAHVGNTDFTRVILGYRNQYPSYSNAFTTYTTSFDTYFDKINSGAGISVSHDNMAKVFKETTIGAAYSYNLKIGGNIYLRAGLQALLRLQSQNPGSLIFPDMIDSNGSIIPNPAPYNSWNSNSFDIGTGLALMIGRLKVGASAYNISGKKQESYSGIALPDPLRINAYASYDIMLSDNGSSDEGSYLIDFGMISISPSVQYMQQYDYQSLSVGAFFKAGSFFIGLHERQDLEFKAFTLSVSTGIEFGRIGLGLSGDIAQLGSISNSLETSAFEVNLSFKLWDNKDRSFGSGSRFKGGTNRGYVRSLGGIRMENRGIDKTKVRRYKCPY